MTGATDVCSRRRRRSLEPAVPISTRLPRRVSPSVLPKTAEGTLDELVRPEGIEPPSFGLEGRCLIQLDHRRRWSG